MWASRVSWASSETGTVKWKARLGFLDLDLESLDVPKLPSRPAPGRQAEGEDHDHEEPEDDGPCFLVHRAFFSL